LSIYSVHEDGFIHEDRYLPSNVLPTIVSALQSEVTRQEFVSTLAEVMDSESSTMPLTVGATGGLRKAVDDGDVTREQISQFKEALRTDFGERAVFRELSGSEEAQCELSAVQYIARHALPQSRPRYARAGTSVIEEVGMLSCGGMSSQLAFSHSSQPTHSRDLTSGSSSIKAAVDAQEAQQQLSATSWTFTSFETNLLGAMAEMRSVGYRAGMGRMESRLWALMQDSKLPRLTGTYVVVELMGTIGKEAGLADRLVPKREAVQLLSQHLNSMQLIAGKDLRVRLADDAAGSIAVNSSAINNPWERQRRPESVSWFQEARPALTLLALTVIESFSAGAWFYFATKFEVGSAQNVLRAQWPLGLFIQVQYTLPLPQHTLPHHTFHSDSLAYSFRNRGYSACTGMSRQENTAGSETRG
jgi:hypothetical protein